MIGQRKLRRVGSRSRDIKTNKNESVKFMRWRMDEVDKIEYVDI